MRSSISLVTRAMRMGVSYSAFFMILLMCSCSALSERKAKRLMVVDDFWLIDDFTVQDSIRPYEIFSDNMFKFYPHGVCRVPGFIGGIPNSNKEAVLYQILSEEEVVRCCFQTDNPWLLDTFDVYFTNRVQGTYDFIVMHLESDSLHYQMSRMR